MSWFRVDDGWALHPKVAAAGKDGRLLWFTSGTRCAADETDGVVAVHMLPIYAALIPVPLKTAKRLVEVGLWHDATSLAECRDCATHFGALGRGDHVFHQWWEFQPSRATRGDPVKRDRENRRKQLYRLTSLTKAVRERDRDLCRYCGIHVRFAGQNGAGRGGDRRSKNAGTFDHVDPFGDNNLSNVVIACKPCNSRKSDRTPEQAGIALLPPPAPYQPTAINGGSIERSTADQRTIDDGREDWSRSGSGPGRVGPDQSGSGRGAAGGIGPDVDASIDLERVG